MGIPENRRTFIKKITALGLFSQILFWSACEAKDGYVFKILTKKQQGILNDVIRILFPESDTLDIKQLHTVHFIDFILADTNYDEDEKNTLLEGISNIEKITFEKFNKSFTELSKRNQTKLITFIRQNTWGEYWLSRLLTIIFESLLLDPIYSVNRNQEGWKWLQHKNGVPRPQPSNKYNTILLRKKEDIRITNLTQL